MYVDSNNIYFICGGASIEKTNSLTGGTISTLYTAPINYAITALTYDGGKIYFSYDNVMPSSSITGAGIYSVPRTGGIPTELVSGAFLKYPTAMVLSGTQIYFLNYAIKGTTGRLESNRGSLNVFSPYPEWN